MNNMAGRRKSGISFKRQKFAEHYVSNGGNQTEAAMRSHSCKNRNVAGVLGFELMQKPEVRGEIERLMDEQNITDEDIVRKLGEGLEAKVVSDYKGEAEETNIPDHKTRHKFLETVVDIKGLRAPQKTENVNYDLKVDAMSLKELGEEAARQYKLLQEGK